MCWGQWGTRARLLPPCRELPSTSVCARHLQPFSGALLDSPLVSATADAPSEVLFRRLRVQAILDRAGLGQGGAQPAVEPASGCRRTLGRRGLEATRGARGWRGQGAQEGHPREGQAALMCDSGQTGPASGLPRLPARTEWERGASCNWKLEATQLGGHPQEWGRESLGPVEPAGHTDGAAAGQCRRAEPGWHCGLEPLCPAHHVISLGAAWQGAGRKPGNPSRPHGLHPDTTQTSRDPLAWRFLFSWPVTSS